MPTSAARVQPFLAADSDPRGIRSDVPIIVGRARSRRTLAVAFALLLLIPGLVLAQTTGTIVWRSAALTAPRYASWNGVMFEARYDSAAVGTWRVVAGASSPTRDERLLVGVNASNVVTGEMWNGAGWTALPFNPLTTVSVSYYWAFDAAYEQLSGDALLVWDNGTTGTTGLSYRVWNGSSWSNAATITAPMSGEPRQMHLVAKPGGNEMVLVVNTSGGDYALVWDGSSWGNGVVLESSGTGDTDAFAAYEGLSGRALVVYGKADASGYFRIWNGTTWSAEGTIAPPVGETLRPRWVTLGAGATSDRVALGVVTAGNGTNSHIWLSVWDGSTWAAATSADTAQINNVDYPAVAVAVEGQSGEPLAAYGVAASNIVRYRSWTSGGGWSAQQNGPNVGGVPDSLFLDATSGVDRVMLSVQDGASDLNCALWSGSTWGSVTELEVNTQEVKNQPFVFLWDVYSTLRRPFVLSGAFTGNGADNRAITGLGFKPDLVVLSASGRFTQVRTSSMIGDVTKNTATAAATFADGVQSLDADGFTLGTLSNVSPLAYYWVAMQAAPGRMKVGSYTGNGSTGRGITGIGFRPALVWVIADANRHAVLRSSASVSSFDFASGNAATYVTSLDADGFTVTNNNRVNGNGERYYYVAWAALAGAMRVGSYTGTGADNGNITGVGFQPEWVAIRSSGYSASSHPDSLGASTDATLFFDGSATSANLIQALQSDGFQLGTDSRVNANLTAYSYFAWARQTAPTISNIPDQVANPNTPIGPIGFTVGDAETPAASLTVTATSSNQTLVPNANIALGGSGASRTITLTPSTGQTGSTTITVTVGDGTLSAIDTFVLGVTTAPTISDIPNQATNEDTPVGPLAFTVGDTETPAGGLVATASSTDQTLVPNANLVLGGSGANRTLTVMPAADQNGTVAITVTVSDGLASSSDVFLLTVSTVNDAPVNVVPGSQSTTKDTALVFSAGNGNPLSVSDDAGAGNVRLTLTATNGTLTLSQTTGLTFSAGDGTADAAMTFDGTLTNINAALNGLGFTPTSGYTGLASLQITTNDLGNSGAGGPLTDTDVVGITVGPGTGYPFVRSGFYTGDGTDGRPITGFGFRPDVLIVKADQGSYAVMKTATLAGDAAKQMTSNTATLPNYIESLDADGFTAGGGANINTARYDWIAFQAAAGFLKVGSYVGNGSSGRAIPGLGFQPALVFVYSQNNNEPVMRSSASTSSFNFAANNGSTYVSSLDADGFTVSNDNRVNGNGTTYHYVAWRSVAGAMAVGSYAGDGLDNRNISGVGFQPEYVIVRSVGNYAAMGHPDSLGASTDSSQYFSNTANIADRIQALQSDGFQVGTASQVNRSGTTYQYMAWRQQTAPTISDIANGAAGEDTPIGPISFTVGDPETSASSLTVTATSSNQALVADAAITLGGSGANRTITVTPVVNRSGVTVVMVTVSDGQIQTNDTFTLTFWPLADTPSVTNATTNEDTQTTSGLVISRNAADGVEVTHFKTTAITNGTLYKNDGITPIASGTFITFAEGNAGLRFTPTANFSGTGSFMVQASTSSGDAGLGGSTVAATITVTAVNDAPTISDIADQTTAQDTPIGPIGFTIGDAETAPASLTVTASSSNQTLVPDGNIVLGGLAASRTITLSPSAGQSGTATITVTVRDGSLSASDTFVARVPGVSVTPTSGLATSEAGGATTFTLALTAQPTSDVTVGLSSSDAAEGTVAPPSVTFTPANWSQAQTVTVTGVDDALDDGDVAYSVVTGAATSADPGYAGVNPADVAVTNSDNDHAVIDVTPVSTTALGVETRVNTTAAGVQTIQANVSQAVATDANGDFVVVWASDLQDGSGHGVYAQRFNADGAPQGAELLVNTTTADDQVLPSVAMDAAGNFVVTWSSNLQDGSGYGVYAQRFNAAGVSQGAEFLVNTTTAGSQLGSSVGVAPAGAFVITWSGSSQDPDGSTGIYAQRYNASGVAQGGEFRVNTYTPDVQTLSSVSMDDAGGFVVTWASNGQDGSDYGVYGQRFDASGTAQGSEFRVNTTTANSQLYSDVAMLPDGRFVVGFQGRNGDGSYEVYFQRYAANGTPVGGETHVNSAAVSGYQPIPSASVDAGGTITIVWNSSADGDGAGVIGRQFDWSGSPVGAEFQVNTTGAGSQVYPEVAAQSGGRFIVAWGGNGTGDADGVFVQRYGSVTTETGGTASFRVALDSQPAADVSIALSSSDTTEGTVAPASLTFTAANWNVAQTVTVTGVDELVVDGNVTYAVATALATSTDPSYNGLDPADVSVTNTDNDTAGITVTPTAGLVTTEAGGTATFTLVLTSQAAADVTIGLSSSDATEGTAAPASLTFTSATWNVPQTVTVTGVDDAVVDGSIAYSIVTAPAVSTDPAYTGVNAADVSATNTDNDTAGIMVTPTAGLVTTETGGTATFTVVLNTQPTADVTVGLSSSDATEGTVAPASVTFTAANWSAPQTVTVTGVDDAVVDGPQTYTIVTAPAVSTDPGYNGLKAADESVTNADDDAAGFTVTPTSGLITTEAGGTAAFTVVLNTQPTADVTIGLSSSDTTEGAVAPVSLTFTVANWNVSQAVTVTGVDDFASDGDVVYAIVTAPAASADPSYGGLDPADVQVVNQDGVNDPPVNGVPGPQTTAESTPLVFSAGNGNPISVNDPDAGGNPVRVTLTAAHGTVTLNATAGLTFSMGDGSEDATVAFVGTLPNVNAALAGFRFTPEASFTGAASLQVSTDDQGSSGTGGPQSDTDTVVITVTPIIPVNTPPTISAIPDQTTAENIALGPLGFTVGDLETPAGSLIVTATSSNQALVPDASLVLGGSGASRTLTITPALNQFGIATIAVTVSDGSASTSKTFAFTVSPANHRKWYFAEGATGVFEEEILIANPNGTEAQVTITYLLPGGVPPVIDRLTVAPTSRRTVRVNGVPGLANTAVSAIVECENDLNLVVERSMYWGGTPRQGGHSSPGINAPSAHWYLAEGASGFFDAFVFIVNPDPVLAAVIDVEFLRERMPPVTRHYTVGPSERLTIWVNTDVPELADNGAYSTVVNSMNDVGVVVERAMYFPHRAVWRPWAGGDDGVGATAPSQTWYFAEGYTGLTRTGSMAFDTYLLLANPGSRPADATVTYYLESGEPVVQTYNVPARERLTVFVDETWDLVTRSLLLDGKAFSIAVQSTEPIVAERAVYWGTGDDYNGWIEATDSIGVTVEATAWGFADGAQGSVDGSGDQFDSFFLVSNRNPLSLALELTLLGEDGTGVVKTFTVPARARFTIATSWFTELRNRRFATFLRSTNGLTFVSERAIYWGNDWRGGHASQGTPWPTGITTPPPASWR